MTQTNLISIIIVMWLLCGVLADVVLTLIDQKVKRNWFKVWFLHVMSIGCGLVYMFGVVLCLVEDIKDNSKGVKRSPDEFNKTYYK